MIQLPSVQLDAQAATRLRAWQADVDSKPSFPERVAHGKEWFSKRNQKSNATFKKVKIALSEMCSGARRCCYCEDSVGDEVEHIRPKDFYPDMVFSFDNYLYACGPCNSPKANKYAILPPGTTQPIHLDRSIGVVTAPDPASVHFLIDPTREDPTDFLVLDLINTFEFAVHPRIVGIDADRASYTLEVLALNTRDYLVQARRKAFGNYLARAEQYEHRKATNPFDPDLPALLSEMNDLDHPTVWIEMKRQRVHIPILDRVLQSCPELL